MHHKVLQAILHYLACMLSYYAILGTAWFSWGHPCPLVLCSIVGFLVRYRNGYGMIGVLVWWPFGIVQHYESLGMDLV